MTTPADGKPGRTKDEERQEPEPSEVVEGQVVMSESARAVAAGLAAEGHDPVEGGAPAVLFDEGQFRDPFSADLAEAFQRGRGLRDRPEPRVDTELRANLLEKPYLMERPEEGAHRGISAVWRSLRDQLHEKSDTTLDSSEPEELKLLERELKARKDLVEAVVRGIDTTLEAIALRLKEVGEPADPADEKGA